MPQNKFALARYQIIDYLLRKKTYVKTSEMREACLAKTGFSVSKRTIQLDIEAMKHDDFLGVYASIGYNTRLKAYYYETESEPLSAPVRFTPEELRIINHLFELCKERISSEYCLIFRNIVVKMELMAGL